MKFMPFEKQFVGKCNLYEDYKLESLGDLNFIGKFVTDMRLIWREYVQLMCRVIPYNKELW